MGDRPVRTLGIYAERMNKENRNKNKGGEKVSKHGKVTFLMLICFLHIHDMCGSL